MMCLCWNYVNVWVCIYICMHRYKFTYACIGIDLLMHAYVYIYIYVHRYAFTYAFTQACTDANFHMHPVIHFQSMCHRNTNNFCTSSQVRWTPSSLVVSASPEILSGLVNVPSAFYLFRVDTISIKLTWELSTVVLTDWRRHVHVQYGTKGLMV